MYVCLCKGINDKVIHQAVVSGEVNSMRDLRQQYGVASQCGCCKNCAKDVLHEALEQRSNQAGKETQLPVSVCYT
ncbi:(2Fe-2S)-binding protein [Idiomarina loihiensis]|jgi:bacterioferritin-associated ferredoxin|uniref:Bacterioferritin-associated ferredoxin n=1 Tax=Idiomarina rhizosphaerae TaxID=2961572 RepID=A0A9X2JVD9_9GAMM|nr:MULTISPECIES: (2Fe-2S)-binding protein [Idiomarina]PHQ91854.1 MAG: (2Fe-2S)-binding protein [Idiomarina sp.]MCP1339871.1 (2Fe-2S)-binding protein [Idiomarina rhizosphaerae]MDV6326441.1 (2Fe-2S)-binding protein [Idiomarina sp. Sol25]MRJ43472.1 (2Fe-2S)-binding protein [Idiomarina loihiensis]TDO53099.1 bacterioferritin-associated ferredoxin [Idiomarina sp. 017G]